jgi:4-hydroxy-3-methylbut-2-enyl diphosphate reductase
MQITLISPRGFCAGVERAIAIVEKALQSEGAPIYVRHEIVHNQRVVDDFKERGVIFIKSLDDVPKGATLIFSAHGVSQKLEEEGKEFNVLDATCPLVKKVHRQVEHYSKERDILLIGHRGHPEVVGTSGRINKKVFLIEKISDLNKLDFARDHPLAYVTQTTLSYDDTLPIIDELFKRFDNLKGPRNSDICYATQNRQKALKLAAKDLDFLLVLGSKNSSNSNRLQEIALEEGLKAKLIDSYKDMDLNWFQGVKKLGITAGASAPPILLEEVLKYLKSTISIISINEENFGIQESVEFKI